ncbi:Ig-like domain-containing protein, partial [Verrucomicrobiota bacterium]
MPVRGTTRGRHAAVLGILLTVCFAGTIAAAPYVYFSHPYNGYTYYEPGGSVVLNGTMYDYSNGYQPITNVEVYCDGTKLGDATLTNPESYGTWEYEWDPMSYGEHEFKAIAYGTNGTAEAIATTTFNASNMPPVAHDLRVTALADSSDPIVISPAYDNESGQTVTPSIVTAPSNGSATCDGYSFRYTPDAGFAGIDTFTYRVDDGFDDSNEAVCRILVQSPANRAGVLVVLVVNSNLFANVLSNEVVRLKTDLENEGYSARIKVWPPSGTSAHDLWTYLKSEYTNTAQWLTGAILIGDVPKAVTDHYNDLVYWNMAEFQTSGSVYTRNIWVSRINADDTSWGSEAVLIKRALQANHDYRTGVSRLPFTAGYYMVPEWWESYTYGYTNFLDVWPALEARGQDNNSLRFLPDRTDMDIGGADVFAMGAEVFDETSHGSSGGYMANQKWFDKNSLYRVIAQARVALITSCSSGMPGGIVNNHIFTRGGGCTYAVCGSAVNYVGDFTIKYRTVFRERLAGGDSWGGAMLHSYPFGAANRTMHYGDLSMGVMASVSSNAMPRIESFNSEVELPYTVNLSVDAFDQDGTVSNIEWFCNGYNGGRAAPTYSGTATNITHEYSSAGTYSVRVEVTDNHKARVWREMTVSVNRFPMASNDTAIVEANQSVTVDVLANDTDPDGHDISIENVVTHPERGTAAISGDEIVYASTNALWTGQDTFVYRIRDTMGGMNSATVTVTVIDDTTSPGVASVRSAGASNRVTVVFDEAVEGGSSSNGAENVFNYTIDNGVSIGAAALDPDGSTVILSTSPLQEGVGYTLSVSNICDVAATPNAMIAQQVVFQYYNQVPGLEYEYYHGSWSSGGWLPDFDSLTPVTNGVVANFSISPRARDT